MYFSHENTQAYDPWFIAQYLFGPVNTIVKNYLLPWMMEPYNDLKLDKYRSKKTKADIYLKYILLEDLKYVVYIHSDMPEYNFATDERLDKIRKGKYGLAAKTDKKHVAIAINSFLTIWLITLPEKFKEWYDFQHDGVNHSGWTHWKIMDIHQTPDFPYFEMDKDSTQLFPHDISPLLPNGTYNCLPTTWNLSCAFKHFHAQKELWMTNLIEEEVNSPPEILKDNSPDDEDLNQSKRIPKHKKASATFEKKETKENEEVEQDFELLSPDDIVMKAILSDDENGDTSSRIAHPEKRVETGGRSNQHATSPPKRRRSSRSKKSVSLIEPSASIFELEEPLTECLSFLNALPQRNDARSIKDIIDQIHSRIANAIVIKNNLISWANANKK